MRPTSLSPFRLTRRLLSASSLPRRESFANGVWRAIKGELPEREARLAPGAWRDIQKRLAEEEAEAFKAKPSASSSSSSSSPVFEPSPSAARRQKSAARERASIAARGGALPRPSAGHYASAASRLAKATKSAASKRSASPASTLKPAEKLIARRPSTLSGSALPPHRASPASFPPARPVAVRAPSPFVRSPSSAQEPKPDFFGTLLSAQAERALDRDLFPRGANSVDLAQAASSFTRTAPGTAAVGLRGTSSSSLSAEPSASSVFAPSLSSHAVPVLPAQKASLLSPVLPLDKTATASGTHSKVPVPLHGESAAETKARVSKSFRRLKAAEERTNVVEKVEEKLATVASSASAINRTSPSVSPLTSSDRRPQFARTPGFSPYCLFDVERPHPVPHIQQTTYLERRAAVTSTRYSQDLYADRPYSYPSHPSLALLPRDERRLALQKLRHMEDRALLDMRDKKEEQLLASQISALNGIKEVVEPLLIKLKAAGSAAGLGSLDEQNAARKLHALETRWADVFLSAAEVEARINTRSSSLDNVLAEPGMAVVFADAGCKRAVRIPVEEYLKLYRLRAAHRGGNEKLTRVLEMRKWEISGLLWQVRWATRSIAASSRKTAAV
ncbi:hypothetical protein JCM10213_007519 [Rhodosporidiobolus nylandii]